jgi:hypothetical protein
VRERPERSHHAQYRSDRLGPAVAGGLRQIRHAHEMNYKNELTIAAIVSDIRASA